MTKATRFKNTPAQSSAAGFGFAPFEHSNLFRISDFGLRISRQNGTVPNQTVCRQGSTSTATREMLNMLLLSLGLAYVASIGLAAAPPEPVIDRLIGFQQYRFGLPPTEFEYDATGASSPVLMAGRPCWRTYVDLFAPSPKFVLIQSSALAKADYFPIALMRDVSAQNLKLAVSFKLLGGQLARSAGILWRARDKDSYYALLAEGLSGEVCLLRMEGGRPVELASHKTAFAPIEWNSLEVSVQGDHITAWLNERLVLETRDRYLVNPGRVGLLTQADTVALFDDFYIQSGEGRIVRKARSALGTDATPNARVADK